jgi:uncharacterized membrane protein
MAAIPHAPTPPAARVPRTASIGGVILGIGLGGFADGIVLHQILQWHHMLSSIRPPTTMAIMRINMLWDGLFHTFVWVATLVGVLLVWSGARRAPLGRGAAWLLGCLCIGWGIFNVVEGLVDHHMLGLHHVRGYAPSPPWDIGFLMTGPVLWLVGWFLLRRSGRARPRHL